MTEKEARLLVASLTHEEKLRLYAMLKALEEKRGDQPCQTKM